jgi:hypothetical protein
VTSSTPDLHVYETYSIAIDLFHIHECLGTLRLAEASKGYDRGATELSLARRVRAVLQGTVSCFARYMARFLTYNATPDFLLIPSLQPFWNPFRVLPTSLLWTIFSVFLILTL